MTAPARPEDFAEPEAPDLVSESEGEGEETNHWRPSSAELETVIAGLPHLRQGAQQELLDKVLEADLRALRRLQREQRQTLARIQRTGRRDKAKLAGKLARNQRLGGYYVTFVPLSHELRLSRSLSYRIGRILVETVARPGWRTILFPLRLAGLFLGIGMEKLIRI